MTAADPTTRLTVVGNRAGMPAPGLPSSGYVVRTPTTTLLLDCGPGVAGAVGAVVDPASIDAVVVTHMHSDHCYDLLPLGKTLVGHGSQTGNGHDTTALFVPEGAPETLRALNGLFPVGGTAPALDRVFDEAFTITEYRPGDTLAVGDCKITFVPTRHVVPCCGVRIETPAGCLAYTGDTGSTPNLLTLAADVDLLVCEATLRSVDRSSHGHLSAAEAGQLAAESGARHLLLTHFSDADPSWLSSLRGDALEHFSGPVSIARPNLTVDLASPHPEP